MSVIGRVQNKCVQKGEDPNCSRLGELLGGVLEVGKREKRVSGRRVKKLSPTNSERMNRALVELGVSAFKVHTLLWKWRGAPAKGQLPFFTIHSLSKFCALSRPTVRVALAELVAKGWIDRAGYNAHHKNSLFRLVPIRDVQVWSEKESR